jgi:hypothetical protein
MAASLAALQRGAGNQAVLKLLGRESGRALDPGTRAAMEARFGHDFSAVRIHDGPQAADATKGLSAKAFTAGAHIAFGAGRYAPGTSSGKQLLAHELAHVVQQSRGGRALPRADGTGPLESAATAAAQGSGPVAVTGASAVGVAAEPELPWWKQRLNPLYQRALEVLPKEAADKLREANATAKNFVEQSGTDDATLDKAVTAAEPVLKPLGDLLGVKPDGAGPAPDAKPAPQDQPAPDVVTPAEAEKRRQTTEALAGPQLVASLQKMGIAAPLAPPPPKPTQIELQEPKLAAALKKQGIGPGDNAAPAPAIKLDNPEKYPTILRPEAKSPEKQATLEELEEEYFSRYNPQARENLAKIIERIGGKSYAPGALSYEDLLKEYYRLKEAMTPRRSSDMPTIGRGRSGGITLAEIERRQRLFWENLDRFEKEPGAWIASGAFITGKSPDEVSAALDQAQALTAVASIAATVSEGRAANEAIHHAQENQPKQPVAAMHPVEADELLEPAAVPAAPPPVAAGTPPGTGEGVVATGEVAPPQSPPATPIALPPAPAVKGLLPEWKPPVRMAKPGTSTGELAEGAALVPQRANATLLPAKAGAYDAHIGGTRVIESETTIKDEHGNEIIRREVGLVAPDDAIQIKTLSGLSMNGPATTSDLKRVVANVKTAISKARNPPQTRNYTRIPGTNIEERVNIRTPKKITFIIQVPGMVTPEMQAAAEKAVLQSAKAQDMVSPIVVIVQQEQ